MSYINKINELKQKLENLNQEKKNNELDIIALQKENNISIIERELEKLHLSLQDVYNIRKKLRKTDFKYLIISISILLSSILMPTFTGNYVQDLPIIYQSISAIFNFALAGTGWAGIYFTVKNHCGCNNTQDIYDIQT